MKLDGEKHYFEMGKKYEKITSHGLTLDHSQTTALAASYLRGTSLQRFHRRVVGHSASAVLRGPRQKPHMTRN